MLSSARLTQVRAEVDADPYGWLPTGVSQELLDHIDDQAAWLDAYRPIVMRYAEHAAGCPKRGADMAGALVCDCGLSRALDELRRLVSDHRAPPATTAERVAALEAAVREALEAFKGITIRPGATDWTTPLIEQMRAALVTAADKEDR